MLCHMYAREFPQFRGTGPVRVRASIFSKIFILHLSCFGNGNADANRRRNARIFRKQFHDYAGARACTAHLHRECRGTFVRQQTRSWRTNARVRTRINSHSQTPTPSSRARLSISPHRIASHRNPNSNPLAQNKPIHCEIIFYTLFAKAPACARMSAHSPTQKDSL